MGISLDLWRCRIGVYFHPQQKALACTASDHDTCNGNRAGMAGSHDHDGYGWSLTSVSLLLLIGIMLVMAGVEPNPGPGPELKIVLHDIDKVVQSQGLLHDVNSDDMDLQISETDSDESFPDTSYITDVNNPTTEIEDSDEGEEDTNYMTDAYNPQTANEADDEDTNYMTDAYNPQTANEADDEDTNYMTDAYNPQTANEADDEGMKYLTDVFNPESDDETAVNDDGNIGYQTVAYNPTTDAEELVTRKATKGLLMVPENIRTAVPISGHGSVMGSSSMSKMAKRKNKKIVRFEESSDSSADDEDTDVEDNLTEENCTKKSRVYPLKTVKTMRCCNNKCTKSALTASAVQARASFIGTNKARQRFWITNYIRNHFERVGEKFRYTFNVGIKGVCQTAWMLINGVTRARFYKLRKKLEEKEDGGAIPGPQDLAWRRGVRGPKVQISMSWLEKFASEFGDKMPDSDRIHLPSSMSRKDVYERMIAELIEADETPCSLTRFLYLWRTEHKKISIPKVNRFSKCDECSIYKSKISLAGSKAERKKLQMERDQHLQHQNAERRKYYKHILKAKTHPEKYLSMIIDGMDQHTTLLPKSLMNPKGLANTWKIPTHVTGIIAHGRGAHTYVDVNEVPHDSNLTINMILQVLKKYAHDLPPVLYLQLDNCGRENKNKFVMGFCCLLVELGIFRKIKMSFLPVGHTHEDIDQFFSRISGFLRKQDVQTLQKLLSLIPKAYKKLVTTAEQLRSVFDIKKWFDGHLSQMNGHSVPHVFKFTKCAETGKAVMHTKMWATTDEQWRKCELTDPHQYPHILSTTPDGVPEIVEPNLSKTKPEFFLKSLPKLCSYPWFKEHHEQDWLETIRRLEAAASGEEEEPIQFPLYDICLDTASINSPSTSNESPAVLTPRKRALEHIMTVQVGPKRKRKDDDDDIEQLQPGKMVCLYVDKYPSEWPQVAEIMECHDEELTIKWYHASYTGICRKFTIVKKKKRGDWMEKVPKEDVLFHPFNLLQSSKLPKEITDLLKEKEQHLFPK